MPPIDHTRLNSILSKQISDYLRSAENLPIDFQHLIESVNNTYNYYDSALSTAKEQISKRTDQLIASTSQAYSFLDSLNIGFLMTDTSGEIVLVNNVLKAILNQKQTDSHPENGPAKPIADLSTDKLDNLFAPEFSIKQAIAICLSEGKASEIDEINFGKIILHIYIAPLVSSAGNDRQILGAVMLIENVTEQKMLNRSKDEFISIASHELRTPLAAIRGNASLIKQHYPDKLTNEDLMDIVNEIHRSSIRLIDIVNDFLDVAAIEQDKIKMVQSEFVIGEVCSEVEKELKPLCEAKSITLNVDSSLHDRPVILADRQRIKQVLINLVGNALKFTDSGSITIASHQDEQFIYISVSDSGRGMSSENQKLLFRKFQQASDNLLDRDGEKGTGLGLYISKKIIELSGGHINLISSEEDVGSTFEFSLPKIKQDTPLEAAT